MEIRRAGEMVKLVEKREKELKYIFPWLNI